MTLYEAAGGTTGLVELASAWHRRCLADPLMSHPFLHPGLNPRHIARLAAYWAEALGGPLHYTEVMGSEADVLRLHSGNGEHLELDERAVACFDAAMTDVGITTDPLRSALHDYFAWSTERMARYADPAVISQEIALPHWDWRGLTTS